jgi:hypothetical protein
MGDLEERAYSTISGSLLSADIGDLVAWLAPSPRIHANGNGTPSGANGNGNGFAFGSVPAAPVPSQPTGAWATAPLAYGEWSRRLRADVEDYLVRALPASITAEGQALHTDPRLLAAYVPLPYELFKACTEAPALPISFIQDRFAFAKRVIAQRKKIAQAQAAAAAAAGIPAAQFEEGVVLALKPEENGMAVHITRKPKRSRGALWKVEG